LRPDIADWPAIRTVPSYHLPNVTAKESEVQPKDGEQKRKPYYGAFAFTWRSGGVPSSMVKEGFPIEDNVLIGYMQNGIVLGNDWKPKAFNYKEGLPQFRRLFNEKGNLILGTDETLLYSTGGVKVDVFDDWAPSSVRNTGKYIFKGYRGAGSIYITNKRIFHFREMDPLQAGLDHSGTGGLPGAILDPMLARRGRELGIVEFCEISLDILVDIIIEELQSGKIAYYFISDWKRYRVLLYGSPEIRIYIFQIIEKTLKDKEFRRYKDGPADSISYAKIGEVHMKFFWMREDIIKKAEKYEKKGKIEKAIIQYNKILEIFPEDESTKAKITQLSSGNPVS
jgi:tetratricopeptide (TPR) repeat protein